MWKLKNKQFKVDQEVLRLSEWKDCDIILKTQNRVREII